MAKRTPPPPESTPEHDTDILIVGGGFAGLTAALRLAGSGYRVTLWEQADRTAAPLPDIRTTAVSFGSAQVLDRTGIWPALESRACPINAIDILDGTDEKPRLVFNNKGVEGQPFGWIIDNHDLTTALLARVARTPNITHNFSRAPAHIEPDATGINITARTGETCRARLLVGADGRQSAVRTLCRIPVREWGYGQTALVGIVRHAAPHENRAVEHFRAEGPFAILPMNNDKDGAHRSAIVWTVAERDAAFYTGLTGDTLAAALNTRFPDRYGAVTPASPLQAYPLSLTHAADMVAPRCALVGDAAHGIHPIAGQGLNLGMRDIDRLAHDAAAAHDTGADIGSTSFLAAYQRARRADNTAMVAATDTLNGLFANRNPVFSLARRLGLSAVQRSAKMRGFFIHQAMGLAS